MAPYDSDSSDGEDSDYTLTNVLLGYTSKDAKEDTISHLGGSPVCSPSLLFLIPSICICFIILGMRYKVRRPRVLTSFFADLARSV
jgi:hypothetical protein